MDFAHYWFQAPAGGGGAVIGNSLRFRGAQYLRLTRPTANQAAVSYSFWVKLAINSTRSTILAGDSPDNGNYDIAEWNNTSVKANAFDIQTNGGTPYRASDGLIRDPGAWYHVFFSPSYYTINGVQQTPSSSGTNWQNLRRFTIGSFGGSYDFLHGYLTEFHFVDGQDLAPTDFGEFNADGVWVPKDVSGLTYGTNGWYLDFSDPADIGADRSGNGNNFTPTGFELTNTTSTSYDWMADSPTDNYSTLNPLDKSASGLYDANLTTGGPGAAWGHRRSTFAMSTGKWYWEDTPTWSGGNYVRTGVVKANAAFDNNVGQDPNGWGYETSGPGGIFNNNTSVPYGPNGSTNGAPLGFAFDADTGKLWVRNATDWFNSGNPATGTNPGVTIGSGTFFAAGSGYQSDSRDHFNFGNRPLAYTPPAGFEPLSTAELPAVAITNPSEHFQTILDSGANILTNAQATFPNGLWWIKDRVGSNQHQFVDSVHGGNLTMRSPERNQNQPYVAPSGNSVAWCWNASDPATNGFEIITYDGNDSNGRVIPHNLGRTPKFIMTNCTQGANNEAWVCWHDSFNAGDYIILNDDNSKLTDNNVYGGSGNVRPTSTGYSVGAGGTTNKSGRKYIAYVWAEVPGYSSIGKYVGNGNPDGPFIYTGFRPAWVMTKAYGNTSAWDIYCTPMNPYNPTSHALHANATNSESNDTSVYGIDILSNGFKFRNSNTTGNRGSTDFVYIAFAEMGFGGSNISPAPAR